MLHKSAFGLLLLFLVTLPGSLATAQSADITLMYRRSGETAMSYNSVSPMDTLKFYMRGGNPYFRVYSIRFNQKFIQIHKAEVESYNENIKGKKSELDVRSLNGRQQMVDTFVEPEEDLIKVSLFYIGNADPTPKVFIFFIKPDLELY